MRSVNLIGQERSSDPIDLYFIFQWTRSVFIRGGAIHDRTTNVNEWRHIRRRNYRTHSNEHPCKVFSVVSYVKNGILVAEMYLFIFNWRTVAILFFLTS